MRTQYLALLFLAAFLAFVGFAVASAFPIYGWIMYVANGLALVCVAGWVFLEKEELYSMAKAPKGRYGAASSLSVLIAILVSIGLAVITSRPNFNKSYDMSRSGMNTLADQSKFVAKQIQKSGENVKVTAFFDNDESKNSFKNQLDLYARHASVFETRYVNPVQDPMLAQSLNITAGNTVIFNYGPREHRITAFSEERITNALISVFKEGSKKIYFTVGHGEPELEKGGGEGYDIVIQELKNNRYEIETLALTETKGVPKDADLVIVAGPQYEFRDEEIESLQKYLEKGGSLLVMVDAMVPTEKLNELTKDYGLSFNRDWLILHGNDPRSMLFGQDNASITKFDESHPLTREFAQKGRVELLIPRSRSINVEDSNTKQAQSLTVSETGPTTLRVNNVNSKDDVAKIRNEQIESGKQHTVVAVATLKVDTAMDLAGNEAQSQEATDVSSDILKPEAKEAKLVLVGSSQIATNVSAQRLENRDFFSFIAGFMLADESLLTIKPRENERARLDVSTAFASLSKALLAFLYPLMFLALWVYFWLTRRAA